MRRFVWISGMLVAVFLMASGIEMYGQDQPAAQGQRRGRGGLQAGQMVQGIVTAAAADKLTIKNNEGNSYDVTITADSRVMKDRQPIKLSDVKPGDSVTAVGEVATTTVQARMVMVVDAATVAKAKENMGKTYITGKITAIDADNLKLTVMRTDNVSQVIAVDDGTSFQRGNRGVQADVTAAGGLAMGGGMGGFGGRGGQRGQAGGAPPAPESITLADIRVGDSLMATGTLKNGAFTALKMGVTEPGQGRRGPQGQGAPDSPPQPPATAAPPQS